MTAVSAHNFWSALSKINRAVPFIESPMVPSVVIDVSAYKMRTANSMQYWQVDAPGIPDMQLVADKAVYLEKLMERFKDEAEVGFLEHSSSYEFVWDNTKVVLTKPVTNFYVGIEEVLLKPTLTNDHTLSVPVEDFRNAVEQVAAGVNPRVIELKLAEGYVEVSGEDQHSNRVSVLVYGVYSGWQGRVYFPTQELRSLAWMIEGESTNFKFGKGTRTMPAPLLAVDAQSGLTVVLSPTHK